MSRQNGNKANHEIIANTSCSFLSLFLRIKRKRDEPSQKPTSRKKPARSLSSSESEADDDPTDCLLLPSPNVAARHDDEDWFKLVCLACSAQGTFEDGMVQCDDGHLLCRHCWSKNGNVCGLCNPKEPAFECSCCCSEFIFEEMVACSEGCLSCGVCLKTFVESQAWKNGSIQCFSSTGCTGTFPTAMFEKANLSPRIVKKVEKNDYKSHVASLGNLW